MTSVASFGGATTAGNFTLIHSGATLGNWVEGFNMDFKRLTPINERQNFWANEVILDGREPAIRWQHEFRLYTEAGSLGGLVEKFLLIQDQVDANPQLLTVNDGDTATVIYNYGQCYITAAALDEPDEFNQYVAAMINVTFLGKTRPTVT
jgi:hypothetical protein